MHLTYDKISPITQNKCVLVEFDEYGVETSLCMETGYQTYSLWLEGSDELKRFEETSPEIVLNTKFVEPSGQVWYKTTIFSNGVVLYPDKVDGVEVWKVGRFKEFVEGQTIKFNWATMERNSKLFVLDDDGALVFGARDFETAMVNFYEINYELSK